MPSSPQLSIRAGTHGLNLAVAPHISPSKLTLTSPDGSIHLVVPQDLFPGVLSPGDIVTMFFSVVKVSVEAAQAPLIELPGLIGIERQN